MSIQCFKLVLLSILLLPFYTWATLSNVANVADVGNVVEINGKAEQVKIIREKKTFSAKPALQLFVHDITQTGDLSTAKLLLKKVKPQKNKIAKVSVFVFENSQFRLNPEILTEGGRKSVIIELSKGILSLIVDKLEKDTDVRVKTPNAVIGIRGSIITLSVQEVCEEGGTGCSLQTSILQANGDIKVLPPQLLLASLDSKAAVTVPSGAMYTISTTAKDTKEPFSAPTEASTSTPSTTTEPSQTSPPSSYCPRSS
ncbi:MAG: FecR domain-containing protein [Deltaproteobacteria bacterium]|nr:FecR domain-containing protein [Deltaproteobacteria bacterium]